MRDELDKEDEKVIEYVKQCAKSVDAYSLHSFTIMLTSGKPFGYSCLAQTTQEAWVLAATKASRFNYPCKSIEIVR